MWFFFFSSRRRHTRSLCDWSSDVCSSDLVPGLRPAVQQHHQRPLALEHVVETDAVDLRGSPHEAIMAGRVPVQSSAISQPSTNFGYLFVLVPYPTIERSWHLPRRARTR